MKALKEQNFLINCIVNTQMDKTRFSDEQRLHLEFIQDVIKRMNSNSFTIKGLAISVFAGVLAVYGSNSKAYFLILGSIAVVMLWFYDTYYLQLERKWRSLYEKAIDIKSNLPLFSMDLKLIDKKERNKFWVVFWSNSIWLFYFFLVIIQLMFLLISPVITLLKHICEFCNVC